MTLKINQPTSINAYVLNTYFKCTGESDLHFYPANDSHCADEELVFSPGASYPALVFSNPHFRSGLPAQINKNLLKYDPIFLDIGHSPISYASGKCNENFP